MGPTAVSELLSQHGIPYENRPVEPAPLDCAAAVELARRARRLFVKAGAEILHFDARDRPITDAEVGAWFVHEDRFLRVPVLVWGDLLVRSYTEALYREALGGGGASLSPTPR
jgi:hypothetical protein